MLVLGLFFSLSFGAQGQSIDIEFIDFDVSDTVTVGEPFTISGTLRNNGTTTVPANVDMLIETFDPNLSIPPFDGDYQQDNFGNVQLAPTQTYSFSRNVIADPAHFPPDQEIIVIIWPKVAPAIDVEPNNNYHNEFIYVRAAGDQNNSSITASICGDQTLPYGFEGSTSAYIQTSVSDGTPPYSYLWNTGETSSSIIIAPSITTIYTVTITDALGETAVLDHTATVIDIRCSSNKVTMCHTSSTPHTHCVYESDIENKLDDGWTLGECYTPFTTSDCGTPPKIGCDCDEGIVSLTLQYNGPSGVTVSGYGEDNNDRPLESYPNVQSGDILTFTSAAMGENKLKSRSYFAVNGNGDGEEIHTSCSQEIQGETFGYFTVVEFTDGEGFTCAAEDLSCQCIGGLRTATFRYLGAFQTNLLFINGTQGDVLGSYTNVQTGDLFTVNAATIGQNLLSSSIFIQDDLSSGFQPITTSCPDAALGVYGSYELVSYMDSQGNFCPVTPSDCDCEGGIKAIAFTYTGVSGATISIYNSDDGSDLIETHTNVMAGQSFTVYAATIGEEKFNKEFTINANGNNVALHTSCSREILGTYGNVIITGHVDKYDNICNVPDYVAPPAPCECDGGMKAIAFTYNGNPGATISIYNSDNGSDLIETHTNVQTGDSFVVYASTIGEEKFNKEFTISILGTSSLELHTSCSQEVLGDFGDLSVTGYVDKYDNICNVPDYVAPPAPCECDGGMKAIAFTYTGFSGATIAIYNSDNNSDLIEMHSNVQSGDSFTVYASTINEDKFNKEFTISVLGSNSVELHTSCSQEVVGTYGNIDVTGYVDKYDKVCNVPDYTPPPGPCECDGGMRLITFQYTGGSVGTASFYNDKDLNASDLILTTMVSPGMTITIDAASINQADFNNDLSIAFNGLQVGTTHTSCSREILGLFYGAFQIIAHTDRYNNTCSIPITPPNLLRETIDLSSFMHVFPNPVQDYMNVYFQIPDLDLVSIELYGSDGRLAKTLIKDEEAIGFEENELTFYLGDKAPGVYFLKTTTSNGLVANHRLIILPK